MIIHFEGFFAACPVRLFRLGLFAGRYGAAALPGLSSARGPSGLPSLAVTPAAPPIGATAFARPPPLAAPGARGRLRLGLLQSDDLQFRPPGLGRTVEGVFC